MNLFNIGQSFLDLFRLFVQVTECLVLLGEFFRYFLEALLETEIFDYFCSISATFEQKKNQKDLKLSFCVNFMDILALEPFFVEGLQTKSDWIEKLLSSAKMYITYVL